MHPRLERVSCTREIHCCRAGRRAESGSLSSGQTSINLSRKVKSVHSAHPAGIFPLRRALHCGGNPNLNNTCHLCDALNEKRVALGGTVAVAGAAGCRRTLASASGDPQGARCRWTAEVETSTSQREGSFDLNVCFVWASWVFTVCQSHVLWRFIVMGDWQVREGMVILLKSLQKH